MSRRPNLDGGLTANEAAVLVRYDQGYSPQMIVNQTGLSRSLVGYVIKTFGDTEGPQRRWNRKAALSCAQQRAAIIAAGRTYK